MSHDRHSPTLRYDLALAWAAACEMDGRRREVRLLRESLIRIVRRVTDMPMTAEIAQARRDYFAQPKPGDGGRGQ
jgi:hypothetical protein